MSINFSVHFRSVVRGKKGWQHGFQNFSFVSRHRFLLACFLDLYEQLTQLRVHLRLAFGWLALKVRCLSLKPPPKALRPIFLETFVNYRQEWRVRKQTSPQQHEQRIVQASDATRFSTSVPMITKSTTTTTDVLLCVRNRWQVGYGGEISRLLR